MHLRRTFILSILTCSSLILTACSSGHDGQELSAEPANCEVSGQSFGIVGGEILGAGNNLSSSTVLVINIDEDEKASTCTGTLIDKNIVLTAAHCIDAYGGSTYVAFTNNQSCALKAVKRTVRKVTFKTPHPEFSYYLHSMKNSSYDLAILKFDGAVPAGYTTRSLPEKNFEPTENDQLVMTGYGNSSEKSSDGDELRFTTAPATNLLKNIFFAQDKSTVTIKNTWIVDQPVTGVCKGDSGGPLYIKSNQDGSLTLVGITSQGIDNRSVDREEKDLRFCHGVSVFTDVRAHLDWINKQRNLFKVN